MKKITIQCDFGGKKSPFSVYIGNPEPRHHPLHFQAEWLSKERGGSIPGEVMESIAKLYDLAQKNNVSFEELCVHALNTTSSSAPLQSVGERKDNNMPGDDDMPPVPS